MSVKAEASVLTTFSLAGASDFAARIPGSIAVAVDRSGEIAVVGAFFVSVISGLECFARTTTFGSWLIRRYGNC